MVAWVPDPVLGHAHQRQGGAGTGHDEPPSFAVASVNTTFA